ncbi:phosphopantetheine-binding protein [Alkalibacter mobilis]|uniref:phosphopantetheine-binding protein n=1 Tax=Alkalibacter mobilis TaxID=2787712 RepID=UPI00189E9C11|nr:acyl carrier protein [Alkalibacter mobilis]MBF7097028.1 acyl carrier protein [Alkalibacter mobilis]
MKTLLSILKDLHPEIDFETHEQLIDKGVLDSFDIVTIAAEIDNEYGVSIPADAIVPENFNSAKALYALIERLEEEE